MVPLAAWEGELSGESDSLLPGLAGRFGVMESKWALIWAVILCCWSASKTSSLRPGLVTVHWPTMIDVGCWSDSVVGSSVLGLMGGERQWTYYIKRRGQREAWALPQNENRGRRLYSVSWIVHWCAMGLHFYFELAFHGHDGLSLAPTPARSSTNLGSKYNWTPI